MTRPAQRSVTIVDVAKAAGVSKSTAGRALTGAGEVSARTREKVARVAAELGYRPNGVARSMITGNHRDSGRRHPGHEQPVLLRRTAEHRPNDPSARL
ncbi:LacI family DNA-binding transcriptional regulator [Streptomyces iranensis]|uniref:LacI family DNA-binding transcriptional regulator n=1 Tax=Streptomyces iranensis TaxID=576784 RepID=UPI0039B763E9